MLNKSFPIPNRIKKISTGFLFLGLVIILWSVYFEDSKRMGFAYLVPYFYFLFIAMGSLFFVSVQYPSGAGWSVNVRRIFEGISSYLPVAFVLIIPLIYLSFSIYEWLDVEHVKHDPIIQGKQAYLNFPFFLIRILLFFGGWLFFYKKLVGISLLQDRDGKLKWTQKATRISVFFLLFFVPSFSLMSVDFLMSLDPHWFSTIYGVYAFSGAFQSALAVIILLTIYFMPLSEGRINRNHLHDLGKFLMGMTLFWAYIAFSQYMLIWYANLPEETTFFIPRSQKPWMFVSIALLVFKFAVPFFCLLPRWVKRNTKAMVILSSLILVMQYIDVYWLVYPAFSKEKLYFGLVDSGFLLFFLGVFVLSVFSFFQKHSVVPLQDPLEHESNAHHVTY